jgi:hypothetical protein
MYWGFDTIALAQFQESCQQKFINGESITPEESAKLDGCVWVKLASVLSPSNLVIRQWALSDLFKGIPWHASKLEKMLDVLSYKGDKSGMRIWAEGHYYFWYAMCILQLWVTKFEDKVDLTKIKGTIDEIRKGLTMTSYYRNKILYGAPYGDVRDVPLDVVAKVERKDIVKISNVSMVVNGDFVTYQIVGKPVGLNLHIPKDDSVVQVIQGIPKGSNFYEGWDKKYKNKWGEIRDLLSWKRIKSLLW